MKTVAQISLHRDRGFPKSEYAFCDGAISAVVEKYGGITDISLIKVWEENGVPSPDQRPTPVISRRKPQSSQGSQFYGAPIRFISTHKKGPNLYHFPEQVDILPFGFDSESTQYGHHLRYRMCLYEKTILCSFQNESPDRDELAIVFYPEALYTGDFLFVKKDTISFVPAEENPHAFPVQINWNKPIFDGGNGLLTARAVIAGKGINEELYFAIASEGTDITCERNKTNIILRVPWAGRKRGINTFILIAESRKELLSRMNDLRRTPDKPWSSQMIRYRKFAGQIPQLEIRDYPEVTDFFRVAPLFLNSMVITETADYICRRAACHKYGFWWIWDHVYPLLGMMNICDPEASVKILKYTIDHGIRENGRNLLTCLLALLAVHESFSVNRTKKNFDLFYPEVKKIVGSFVERCDKRGMFADVGGTGADDPGQVGVRGEVLAPELIGLWYSVLRLTENSAMAADDEPFAAELRRISDSVKDWYLKTFYDDKYGYLVVSVNPDTGDKNRTFQDVVTMAMDGLYGPNLLLEKVDNIASFIENQLAHPRLRVSVPFWNRSSELWHSCIMIQHSCHESRTLRFTGRGCELMRYFDRLIKWFGETGTAVESLNLTDLLSHQITQDRDWQAFGARARYALILQTILGIEFDYGGLTYIPCDTPVEAKLKNLNFAGRVWNVSLKGKGQWVKSITVNGKKVEGTYKIPASCVRTNGICRIIVERGVKFPDGIILSRAPSLEVRTVSAGKGKAVYELSGWARSPVWILSRKPVKAFLNGKKVEAVFYRAKNLSEIDVVVRDSALLEIKS